MSDPTFTRANRAAILTAATGRAAPTGPSKARIAVLTEIASRYAELVEPLNGPDGIRGDGGSPISMPKTYTPTVREFERLVVALRLEERTLWWHLDGWWLAATTRTMFHCPRCGPTHQSEHVHSKRTGPGLIKLKCKRIVVARRRQGARETQAERAIEWIAERWSLEHEPMLPDEIRAT